MEEDTKVFMGATATGLGGWYLSTKVYRQKGWIQWAAFVWTGFSLGYLGSAMFTD